MSKRVPITAALDVRSTEHVIVLSDITAEEYPQNWIVCAPESAPMVDGGSVVIIDRVELLRRELAAILTRGPRILAVIVDDDDQEHKFLRTLRTLYPWAEVWTTHTNMGRTLMTVTYGRVYDRDAVVDMRQGASA